MNTRKRDLYYIIAAILIICVLISTIQNYIITKYINIYEINLSITNDDFRKLQIGDNLDDIYSLSDSYSIDRYEVVATLMIMNEYNLGNGSGLSRNNIVMMRNRLVKYRVDEYIKIVNAYRSILADVQYFPVAASSRDTKWVNYVDSWGNERTYGGERQHEGTDIMAGENVKGLYPIISVSDGTVTNKGWLEKGGYRIGITSQSGGYYYYAHLASYAENIEIGSEVVAGQLIGFMGNTGYSKVEGTTDKFDVHLHFGIYLYEDGEEVSVNPYWALKFLENKVLYYSY